MKTYIALLRGINVSGQKMIKMAALLQVFTHLKMKNAKHYLQSGNVVFQYQESDTAILQKKTEKKIKETFGFDVSVIILPAAELPAVLKNNPFLKLKALDVSKLYLTFLNGKVDQQAMDKIAAGEYGTDKYVVKGNVIYLYLPNNYGTTKLHNNFWESKLKLIATTRNWKTMNALKKMTDELEGSMS